MLSNPRKIGVDIGGVVFTGHMSSSVDIPHAIATLALMVGLGYEPHIVSSCAADSSRITTMELLDAYSFTVDTGIPWDHIHFVKQRRLKFYKLQELGIDAMIEDRGDILDDMISKGIKECFWFTNNGVATPHPTKISRMRVAKDWLDLALIL